MRQQQLVARKKRAFRPKTTVATSRAETNRIANLVPEGPDQIWVSDITYVATAEGWPYLAVISDLFSRRVVGWKLNQGLEAKLVHQAPGYESYSQSLMRFNSIENRYVALHGI